MAARTSCSPAQAAVQHEHLHILDAPRLAVVQLGDALHLCEGDQLAILQRAMSWLTFQSQACLCCQSNIDAQLRGYARKHGSRHAVTCVHPADIQPVRNTWNSRRSSSTHEMIVLDSLCVTPDTMPVTGSSPAPTASMLGHMPTGAVQMQASINQSACKTRTICVEHSEAVPKVAKHAAKDAAQL